MTDYDRTNTGIISKNDRKTEDRHPDYTGTLDVNGVAHFIDGWIKQRKDKTGSFLSLRIKPKQQQASQSPKHQTAPFDEDPPF